MTRTAALLFLAIALVVICLPAAAVSLGRRLPPYLPEARGEDEDSSFPHLDQTGSYPIRLYLAEKQEVIKLDLEDYLVGVVMAEMPASFGLEALKAQAVVARTYALHRLRFHGGGGCDRSLQPADLCSDSTHCQAWVDPALAVDRWPQEQQEEYLQRIRQAVAETAGEVVLFNGALVEAVYHSTCGGKTETSTAIWSGGSVPYLQSVRCPYCRHSPYYRSELLVPYEQLEAAFQQELAWPAGPGGKSPLRVAATTPGDRVGVLQVNGTRLEGKEVRRLLELPSTDFSWEFKEDGVLFFIRGHGHGVGLCQYGADGAAAHGLNYRDIIAYYYTGAEVGPAPP